LQFAYFLAEHLHKTVAEILQMDVREYQGWLAWFQMKADKNGK
jgi:hypothetical protein